ncbi:MAG: M48 family peptidase [Betaproteobacteria bacterium]|nr:MAG: M48 family peptidase [Betaproteobacteria bacterium]
MPLRLHLFRSRWLGSLALIAAATHLGMSQAQRLPELGDSSGSLVSAAQERRMGQEAMRELRASGAVLNDPEVNGYLNELGKRILSANPEIREPFEFFAVADSSVNAFAMPGGFIGVNMGLVLLTQTESELAGVLAHEIAHVTQKHYARQLDDQRKNAWMQIAGIAAAVLAARAGNGDAAQGALLGSQAAQIQGYLNFSRDNEREADRIGFQYLRNAQFDPGAMSTFMERLQRATSVSDTGAVPGYLRTHPVTIERVGETRALASNVALRLPKENSDYFYVRALLRSYVGDEQQAIAHFKSAIAERKFSTESSARYGLAAAYLRAREFASTKQEIGKLSADGLAHPMFAALLGQAYLQNEEFGRASEFLTAAIERFPNHTQLHYDLPEALLRLKQPKLAMQRIEASLAKRSEDVLLLNLASRAAADLGQKLRQHRFLGEQYFRQGNLSAALDQFELSSKAGDGDYFEASYVEARARDMKREIALAAKDKR